MLDFQKGTPEENGIPSVCIENFIDRLARRGIPMHSILLLRHDRLVAEGYYAPYRADTLHRMFSISKSFTSIAIGLLADEGKLALDDKIVTYFPDKVPSDVHPWISAMTIRDMLMMRTCHASTTYKVDMKRDWVQSFFTEQPTHPSGKIFHYDTSSAHTLSALVERLSGMPMLSYLKKKLAPLGLSEASYMLTDPFGVSMGGSGLVATPMDLLRFGYFIAHRGLVEGQQLLSSSYIDTAVSCLTATMVTGPVPSECCGYGYQFWRNERNGYTCYGMGGQFILFIPDADLILVTTADTQGIGGGNQQIHDALFEEILPHLSDVPLPAAPAAAERLHEKLSGLHMVPLSGRLTSPLMDKISEETFLFDDNEAGFSGMQLSFAQKGDGCPGGTVTLSSKDRSFPLSFGLGFLVTGIFAGYDMKYAASGIWLDDHTFYVKAHIIDSYVGSLHWEFSFGDSDVTVYLRKQEETLFREFQGHYYGRKTGT
ncbi:MAG: serine hydrolase domain-containing protein [Roseburia sp.]